MSQRFANFRPIGLFAKIFSRIDCPKVHACKLKKHFQPCPIAPDLGFESSGRAATIIASRRGSNAMNARPCAADENGVATTSAIDLLVASPPGSRTPNIDASVTACRANGTHETHLACWRSPCIFPLPFRLYRDRFATIFTRYRNSGTESQAAAHPQKAQSARAIIVRYREPWGGK